MGIRKIVAVDVNYAERVARELGLPYLPVKQMKTYFSQSGNVDLLEMLVTVVQPVPDNDGNEAVGAVFNQVERKRHALEMSGCRTILCPAERSPGTVSGYKQSDDQRLMIATLSICLRLKPDFLLFVAADGDYAPMLWELRNQGVRSEVVARERELATDLRRVAFSVQDLEEILKGIRDQDYS